MRRAISTSGNVLRTSKTSAAIASLGNCDRCGPTNPSAADDHIAIVTNRGLSGRNCFLRLVQPNECAIVVERNERGRRARMVVPDLDIAADLGSARAPRAHLAAAPRCFDKQI